MLNAAVHAGLAALIIAACCCLFVLISPHRECTWCHGQRRAKKHRYWGRVGLCRKCKGAQKHKRLGAVMVHRFFWSVIGERWMARRREGRG